MRAVLWSASFLGLAAVSTLAERPARACGGCFHVPTPTEVTVVTDHRMAFSISQQQSVLWDQIEYSGSPSDFAWVLPVMPGAQVQLSHDEFFAALDAMTTPTITGPTPNCGSGGGAGCAFAGGSAAGSSLASPAAAGGGSGVQVISQSVVGPYDTVTVHSTDPNALYAWLTANSYDIPDSMRPIIDAYVAANFDFIALRLAPGQGVQAMQPVRVVTPGAGLTLPLRMVSAGVGAQVGITLYVIGEGRYEAQNFPNAVVDDAQLEWLHAQSRSNYTELSEQLMSGDSGRTWLTEFSMHLDLGGSAGTPQCYGGYTNGYGPSGTLAQLYFAQCSCQAAVYGVEAGTDAGADAAAGPCAGYDDLDVAGVGLYPASTWVTRMRANLPSDALPGGDLVLQASAAQNLVSNYHYAKVYDDPTYSPCGAAGGGGGCAIAGEPDAHAHLSGVARSLAVGSLALLTSSWVLRRRRRPRWPSPDPSPAGPRASRRAS
jgi:hypothetical protein